MTSTAGVDRCFHHQRYVDTCHDCRYTVEGVSAARIEDERVTLKKQNAQLLEALRDLAYQVDRLKGEESQVLDTNQAKKAIEAAS